MFKPRFGIRTLLAVTSLTAIGIVAYQSYQEHKRRDEIEAIIERFHKIDDPREYSSLYRKVFAIAQDDLLPWLQRHENHSVALQATWEDVERSVPEESSGATYRPDRQKIAAFIDFLERQQSVSVPQWWKEVVLDCRANQRHNVYSGRPRREPYHDSGISWVRCPTEARVEPRYDEVVYYADENQITIPAGILDRMPWGKHVSACFTDASCFVAVHDDIGYPHDVTCIDRKTNKLLWTSTACGSWWGVFSGRPGASWVSVVSAAEERVFVFGAGWIGFYVHGFDAASGDSLVQFSNNY